MNDQAMKFRLGIFVLGAAVLLAVLIVLFGDLPDIFRGQLHYTVRFATAPGLEAGSPVRKSGIRIGEVTSYALDPESGIVTVSVSVDRKYQLRKGDTAALGRGLLGDATVNFQPLLEIRAPSDREPAPTGYVYEGKTADFLSKIGAAAGDLVPASQATLDELRDVSKKINEMLPEFRRTMQETQVAMNKMGNAAESADNILRGNQDRIVKTLDNVSTVAERLSNMITPNMTRRIETILVNAETASAQVAALLNDENRRNTGEVLKSARSAMDRFTAALNDENIKNLSATLKSLQEVGSNVSTTLKNLDTGVTDARQLMKNADGGITDARKVVNNINGRVDTLGPQLDATMKDASTTMKRFTTSAEKLDTSLTNIQSFTKELGERGPALIKNLEEASSRMSQVVIDVGTFSKSLAQGDGTIRKLVSDPGLYNSLNDAAAAAGRGVSRFDRLLYDLSIFSDKIARHPELLGVSGAVSPSSGIKR
jgi:phospholipid/cholesterol/gamma-HCH transport system substrate-binding protein